jgi:hypothetical protein
MKPTTIFRATNGTRIATVMAGIPAEMTVAQYVRTRCRACGVAAKLVGDGRCTLCDGITEAVQP